MIQKVEKSRPGPVLLPGCVLGGAVLGRVSGWWVGSVSLRLWIHDMISLCIQIYYVMSLTHLRSIAVGSFFLASSPLDFGC